MTFHLDTPFGVGQLKSPNHPLQDRTRALAQKNPLVFGKGRGHVFAVMDGVSSAPRATDTAALIEQRLEEFFTRDDLPATPDGMLQLLTEINVEAHAWGEREDKPGSPLAGAAATIVWLAPDEKAHIFHVGDTAVYALTGDELQLRTAVHGTDNALHRYFGQTPEHFKVDHGAAAFTSFTHLLLVSDGVTKTLYTSDLLRFLVPEPGAEPDLQTAPRRIVEAARARGSLDDITAVLVEFGDSYEE